MRFASSLLLTLSAIAVAEEQAPLIDRLKGLINKATAAITSNVPSVVPHPVDAGASMVAQAVVQELNFSNWKTILTPDATSQSDGPEEWMVYITGGNKTCYGLCTNATKAWNASTALLASSSNPPKLAVIDCEAESILCNSWAVTPPAIYHMLLPKPLADQSKPATTIRYIGLNTTSITAQDIAEIHTKKRYMNAEPYEGYWHPFDGLLAKTHLNLPLGYILWAFARMPSWLPMIVVSFLSRQMMNRRAAGIANRGQRPQGRAAPPAR